MSNCHTLHNCAFRAALAAAWDEERSKLHLVFPEQVVEHPEELQHSLLPPRVRKARIVDHEVRVDFAVVAADVEAARRRVVLLHDLHARHEALDVNLRESGEGQ